MANKGIPLKVGPDGSVVLPKDALDAIDVSAGGDVKLFVDTRRKSLRIERHVDDVWAEALGPRTQKNFDDVLSEQRQREKDAEDIFNRRSKDAGKEPGKKDSKPEDHPDRWR